MEKKKKKSLQIAPLLHKRQIIHEGLTNIFSTIKSFQYISYLQRYIENSENNINMLIENNKQTINLEFLTQENYHSIVRVKDILILGKTKFTT